MEQKANAFFEKAKAWKEEMILLREIVLSCKLQEEFKWMHPCYTCGGDNIVLIHSFKEYCALLFFKGVLMKDEKGVLVQQTKNVQDRRQLRFKNLAEIKELKTTIVQYINEAVAIEKSGAKVEYKTTAAFEIPEEFALVMKKNAAAKRAFENLTPGRQRAYLLFFASAKQSATRVKRIGAYLPKILDGKGKDD